MFVAQEKLDTNIAEYIIYMYQVEDLIRSYHFDLEAIKFNVIRPQTNNEALQNQAMSWYEDIVKEMKARDLNAQGHLFRIGEVMTELIYLHNILKEVVKDAKYLDLLEAADENVESFRKKSDMKEVHLVEVCFNALYMKFLLRIQGKQISEQTEKAFDTMRVILAYLSKAYHLMKKGDMSMLGG